jgi:hypothetical protein
MFSLKSIISPFLVASKDIYGGQSGGVVDVTDSAAVVFDNCSFRGNRGSRGAAIAAQAGARVTATDCHFIDNLGLFGGVLAVSSNVIATLQDCNFHQNMVSHIVNVSVLERFS